MQAISVGIDMSVSSPGIAILSKNENEFFWNFGYFAQRIKDATIVKKIKNVTFTDFEKIPESKDTIDVKRYQHVLKNILKFLETHHVDASTTISIENYAFVHPSMAGNSYKLHEITGILQFLIFEKFNIYCQMVSVSSWKKKICGNGHATKHGVVCRVNEILNFDIMKIFGYTLEIGNPKQQIKNPVQDICDAFCICVYNIDEFAKIVSKKRKKISKK
jgi:Holliday junction resolvasome RuvABC endonuclease subunit